MTVFKRHLIIRFINIITRADLGGGGTCVGETTYIIYNIYLIGSGVLVTTG